MSKGKVTDSVHLLDSPKSSDADLKAIEPLPGLKAVLPLKHYHGRY